MLYVNIYTYIHICVYAYLLFCWVQAVERLIKKDNLSRLALIDFDVLVAGTHLHMRSLQAKVCTPKMIRIV